MVETLIIVFLIVLLIALATAPLEALEWWADWFKNNTLVERPHVVPPPNAGSYIVYLTGISGMDADQRSWREMQLFERLAEKLPDAVIVSDIFPYSMQNRALTGQRVFRHFWRLARRSKLGSGPRLAGLLINLRNMLQVAVAADHRYGPIYNRGSAELVCDGLRRHGYDFESSTPIYLIGYSGGGQIALGAAAYLNNWTPNAPVIVITLGAVFSSNRGIQEATRFYHIVGKADKVARYGHYVFPQRWPIWRGSLWNEALRSGKAHVMLSNATSHSGRGSYMDPKEEIAPGVSPLDETVMLIAGIVHATG